MSTLRGCFPLFLVFGVPGIAPESPSMRPPSERVCAAVTVALGLYLVGLVLSMLANTGSGGSPLVTTIKGRLFSPVMAPAWLDLGFDYRLTHGLEEDADHLLDVRRHDDPRAANTIRLPGDATGERAARWRRLARAVMTVADDPDRDAILPTAIGTGLFDEAGSDDLVIRVLRLPLPERHAPPEPARQASSARVRLIDGRPQFIRQPPRGEVAPVVPRPSQEATP